MRVGNNAPQNVWTWDMRCQLSSPVSFREMYSISSVPPSRANLSPDRFLSSAFDDPVTGKKFESSQSNIHHSSRLPKWLACVISTTLGISSDKKNSNAIIASILHMLTLLSGMCYGACGLYFNFYDTMSSLTRTTVLVSVANCIIGMYWIVLGIYSHSLAARLFGNNRMVECIRLHSKTFMKVNVVIIIAIVATSLIALNLYDNAFLLDRHPGDNVTHIYHANCPSIGVKVFLCQVYYTSKIVYSCLSLCWNLMVASICLSVCRTLTIGIRRFMRELSLDSQIFEEYQMIQSNYLNERPTEEVEGLTTSWSIWDDDIQTFEQDVDFQHPSKRENLLKSMRIRRKKNSTCLDNFMEVSMTSADEQRNEDFSEELMEYAERPPAHMQDVTESYVGIQAPDRPRDEENGNKLAEGEDLYDSPQDIPDKQGGQEIIAVPIMSNQDLMFTYFKLMRRLSSTSRLLQRWISSWLTFVILWCSMLIIYWTSHSASLISIMQFLLPIVTVVLTTSAYAEVNFEGDRVVKCIVPTEERMSVIYYFQNARLELKIFSFVMTYNVLMTALAGVALTIASRIIIDQFN